MLALCRHSVRGSTPVTGSSGSGCPLWQRGRAPLARRLCRDASQEHRSTRCSDPGCVDALAQSSVPVIGKVGRCLYDLLLNQSTPIVSDLQGWRVIKVNRYIRSVAVEGARASLPGQSVEPARIAWRKVGHVNLGVGLVQRNGFLRVLGPGGRDRQVILVEDILAVEQAHGTAILGNGVDLVALGYLAPRPGHKVILDRACAVLGQVNQFAGKFE